MDTLVRDLRYALRQLRLSPGYAALAIVSIGIGIGATTTIFSLVEAFLLPAGARHPRRPPRVCVRDEWRRLRLSFLLVPPIPRPSRPLACAHVARRVRHRAADASRRSGEAQLAVGFSVSGNFFKTFGATPALGRFFLPEEDVYPGGGTHPVVVASHTFWERRLAATRAQSASPSGSTGTRSR